jgi:diaminohydroxyphosphoribosylaminopyrimidine deaminase/5-amino-6-(5-phosphoribosylamino)uracil reductase
MAGEADERFMARALELAKQGLGVVSPNPMVGCVLVHNDAIIAEGWHEKYGGAHAEVNAINQLNDHGILKETTAYITLEPCCHFGKTPPCADLLVKHKIKKVVIANQDIFPLVDGGGIKKLKEGGVEVEVGVLSAEARELNKRFFTRIEKKRPHIILKWAQTADGFIGRENFDSKWISNEHARKTVHKWRAEEDGILVGTNTARYDNPMLNVRHCDGSNPIRMVIDKQLELDESLNLFNQEIPTIIYNYKERKREGDIEWVKVDEGEMLDCIFLDLRQRGVQSVLVEGGGTLLQSFIDKGAWDEARVFYSEKKFGSGIKAPTLDAILEKEETIENDVLKCYKPKD